mmetsp:Transcript_1625/g.4734  ORF Transcript_1625/g.4734 Transcript_1625/m.4734 type:complete len:327 (-) Transcript_1625:31-1011(-)
MTTARREHVTPAAAASGTKRTTTLLKAATAVAALGSHASLCGVLAFSSAPGRLVGVPSQHVRSSSSRSALLRPLQMSSIERDDPPAPPTAEKGDGPTTSANEIVSGLQNNSRGGNENKEPFDLKKFLPPPPEDQLAMGGDIIALFVYAFLDHFLNDLMASALASTDPATAAAIDPETATQLAMTTAIPVWYDISQHAGTPFNGVSVLPSLGYVPYAPAISTAGTSAVILVSTWLLTGWITGAFLYKNTLECSVSKAVATVGRTWVSATVISVGIALASDAWYDCVTNPSLGGLTKADADFLFGSLSVLAMWRFVLSSMLGSGGGGD